MKKIMFLLVAIVATVFSANAQVKVKSPHPDLDIKIKRVACTNGTVVIDMVLTNFGEEMTFDTRGSSLSAYDDDGNAYNRNNIEILLGIPIQGLKQSVDLTLPKDIPLKFRIQLKGISSTATKLSLLKFCPHYGGSNPMGLKHDNYVELRNLEWKK